MIKYSVIIPVKEINDYVRETIPKILQIERDDYEIIVYPNVVSDEVWLKTRQIATGRLGPAEKRSLALRDAQGEILVFFDDDSYPQNDYFDRLDRDYANPVIVAVGGPGVTPPHDSFGQKVSGAVFLSRFSGGFPERYVPMGEKRFVDDWPSVNLTIRIEIFRVLGGFDTAFWPGEDTKLCLELRKRFQKQVLYDPGLIVYHHRRAGFLGHLRQVWGYGLHRGFFARKYPETSRKLKFFVPTAFVLFIVSGVLAVWDPWRIVYLTGLISYGAVLLFGLGDIARYERNPALLIAVSGYIVATHLTYGVAFARGLFTRQLKSTLR